MGGLDHDGKCSGGVGSFGCSKQANAVVNGTELHGLDRYKTDRYRVSPYGGSNSKVNFPTLPGQLTRN